MIYTKWIDIEARNQLMEDSFFGFYKNLSYKK